MVVFDQLVWSDNIKIHANMTIVVYMDSKVDLIIGLICMYAIISAYDSFPLYTCPISFKCLHRAYLYANEPENKQNIPMRIRILDFMKSCLFFYFFTILLYLS